MSRDEIKEKVKDIFKDVFACTDIELTDSMTSEDIDGWNSLTHLQLIMEVEQCFGIKLTTAQIRDTKNVGHLFDIIQKSVG